MTTPQEATALAKAAASGGVGSKQELLRFLRKEKVRRPDLVIAHGIPLLDAPRALGDEVWTVYEQVFKAALDTARDDVAYKCIGALEAKFPGTTRVRLLTGMHAAYHGDFEAAESINKAILAENPANVLAMKLQIASAKAQNKPAVVIRLLNTYLETFAGDPDAWQELAELQAGLGNYEAAAFCYEELVLLSPRSPHHHCRLAELYHTAGGSDNVLKARKQFAVSLECCREGNTRALLGLCAACVA
ncbi:unnamed protein product, partial [Phaeothamnion confervicola]